MIPRAQSKAYGSRESAADIVTMALWFGMLSGFVEVAARLIGQKQLLDLWLYFGPQYLWMAPLTGAVVFAVAALLLLLASRRWPRLASFRAAVITFTLVAAFSLMLLYPKLHKLAALVLAAGIAVQASRILARRARSFRALVQRTVVVLGALVLALAIGVHGWQWLTERRALAKLPPAPGGAPNVLLIVLDTVRAQNLSLYGYERRTTPELERLAASGIRFERALSTASWTPPSHASMFTGRFPHELLPHWHAPLDDTYPTLAEVLAARGYLTAGIVGNVEYTSRESGLARGFARYEDYLVSPAEFVMSSALTQTLVAHNRPLRRLLGWYDILGRKDAAEVNRHFLRWLDRRDERPFFAFLNYYDAHEPYLPPEPFEERFGSTKARKKPLLNYWKRQATRSEKKKMSPEEIQAELDAYDGTIAFLDQHLGRLFDELRKRGLLQNTLIVVTSDHGEQFGEHGLFAHANSLYRQLLHVPLVIALPGEVPAGRSLREPVSLRDIPATVLDLVEPGSRSPLAGRSLRRTWSEIGGVEPGGGEAAGGGAVLHGDTLLAEFARGSFASPPPRRRRAFIGRGQRAPQEKVQLAKSLVAAGYHYILTGDGRDELYDFEKDPAETRDLAGSERGREEVARFRPLVEGIVVRARPPK